MSSLIISDKRCFNDIAVKSLADMNGLVHYLFLVMMSMVTINLSAQVDPKNNTFDYVDLTDLKSIIKGGKDEGDSSGIPQKGKLMLFVVPIFGANPSLGTFYGVGGTAAKYIGDPANTSISNLNGSVLFTTKDQFVASLKGTIMTPANSWEMLVDVKFSFFSENTYGLGSDYNQPVSESWNFGGIGTSGVNGAQPLTFKYIKVHYTALKAVAEHIYAGLGYHLDYHFAIEDPTLNLSAEPAVVSSHYGYSVLNGFSPDHYTTSGTSLNVVFDSRDHTISPYRGAFLQMAYRVNTEFLGSKKNSQQLYLEARLYKALSKKMPRHLIGLWTIGQFEVAGDLPYLDLPASSYDMRNRIGRGYVAGRFRGPGWVTSEVEYRLPISRNGLFGAVAFASATTTSRNAMTIGEQQIPRLNLFEAIRTAGGVGIRMMLDRAGRLNLAADIAFGQHGSSGFYFAVGETF